MQRCMPGRAHLTLLSARDLCSVELVLHLLSQHRPGLLGRTDVQSVPHRLVGSELPPAVSVSRRIAVRRPRAVQQRGGVLVLCLEHDWLLERRGLLRLSVRLLWTYLHSGVPWYLLQSVLWSWPMQSRGHWHWDVHLRLGTRRRLLDGCRVRSMYCRLVWGELHVEMPAKQRDERDLL